MSARRLYALLHMGDTCALHGLPRVPTAVQPFSGRVKCLKPPCHPLFYCLCISFWLGHLAPVCHSLRKQCSSYRWDGLGSAIYSPHLNPQLTGSCVLENWHITLQGAYCHPQTIGNLSSKMITNEYQLLMFKNDSKSLGVARSIKSLFSSLLNAEVSIAHSLLSFAQISLDGRIILHTIFTAQISVLFHE